MLCGDAANVPNCDLDVTPNTNLIQNGADAVALYTGNGSDFPNATPVTTVNLIDAIVYDTNDGDDTALLVLLNASQPQVNEDEAGDKDNHSNSRVPDGGTSRNTDTYIQQAPTPGTTNVPSPPSTVVINEVDADTPSTDMAEFVELYDGGTGNTDLSGLVLVFFNGSDDASYEAFDLDGKSTNADGFFLLGNTGVTPTPDITFGNNTLQNGADAVALYTGNGSDFPNDTPVTTVNLIDAIVYDTNDGDDTALLVLLNASQPQVNEDEAGDQENHSNSRVPDGGTSRNTDTYIQQAPTPGTTNVPDLEIINDKISAETQLVFWNFLLKQFSFELKLTNISTDTLCAPVFVEFDTIFTVPATMPTSVTVANADGGGTGIGAIYDYSDSLGGDNRLDPGEMTTFKLWIFNDPDSINFFFFTNVFGIIKPSAPSPIAKTTGAKPEPLRFYANIKGQTLELITGTTDVEEEPTLEEKSSIPTEFALQQNYPNPFNPETTIQYQLPHTADVTINIYNLHGQLVRKLVNENREAGFHEIVWDARDDAGRSVPSGVYLYRIQAGSFMEVRKLMLLR